MTTPGYYLSAIEDPLFWRRFWASTRPGGWGCIEWRGRRNRGYGVISHGGRTMVAHRLAWMMYHGQPVPDGMVIDHLCRFKGCVNPIHLEAVTDAVNSRRFTRGVPGWLRMKNGRAVLQSERKLYTSAGNFRSKRPA